MLTYSRPIALTAGALLLLGGLGACSSDSGGGTSPSPSAPATSPAASPTSDGLDTVVFNEKIQGELAEVGCHPGPIDGVIGPETDAAIMRFQTAAGLAPTGELDMDTNKQLKKAAATGTQVCTDSTSSPTPTSSPAGAPCTAQAISAALEPDAVLNSYICVNVGDERWAAGSQTIKPATTNFFAKAEGASWVAVSLDQVCGTASAGLPEKLLDYCGMT